MAKTRGTYGTFIIILVSTLAVLAVYLISTLEVYEQTVRKPASAELRSNSFYILGAWLSESGHPVRFSPRWTGLGDLSYREGGLFLVSSLVDWEKDGQALLSWVQEGGVLIVSVDTTWYMRDSEASAANLATLEAFLDPLGLRLSVLKIVDDPAADEAATVEATDDGIGETDETEGEGEAEEDEADLPIVPNYDWMAQLEVTGEPRPEDLVLQDSQGNIRLVRRALGRGQLTVTGHCYFMYNYMLNYVQNDDSNLNARLSWELTGAALGAEKPGMLFVRGRRAAGGLLAALRARGNLLPPLLSVLALVLIGFWTVIPGFGVRRDEEPAARGTVGGRFAAEARFLRRYGAYRVYLETYLRELRRRGGGLRQPELEKLEAALAVGTRISQRKMAGYLKNLMSALERI
ncbi:MAG: hypothetical protein LBU00_04525 [Treponema sp.]|jgi:hypothetical protein|nr:hypothetical protein [Treponema sp.]